MIRALVGAAMALVLVGCAASQADSVPTTDSLSSDGRDIAEAQCAACHAVGSYGESPDPAAPRFRTILSRYRANILEEDLIAGIQVAHPMPAFQFNPQSVDALIAYLQSIQMTPPEARRSEAVPVDADVEQGRRLAEINCATCHAIGPTGESRHPMAPPFRTLSRDYPLNSLEEAFAEGILVGHPAMPEFRLTPTEIDHLLAYIGSIQSRRGG